MNSRNRYHSLSASAASQSPPTDISGPSDHKDNLLSSAFASFLARKSIDFRNQNGSLYTFSQETKEALRKFRLGTSRAKNPQAKIYMIDIKTQEIKAASDDTYSDMRDVGDELPDSSPRFILLSYPLTLPSGRLSVPYVLVYYLPENCNPNQRMSYAGAVELMRSQAEVNKVLEIETAEEIEEIEKKLLGED